MKRIALLMGLCFGLLAPPLLGVAAGQSTYRDDFNSVAWNGSTGTVSWTATPWVETDSGATGQDPANGNLRVRTGDSGCPNGSGNNCMRIEAANTADNIYRPADLSSAASATLTYRYTANTNSGSIESRVSYDGGASWTLVRTHDTTQSSAATQSFTLTQFTANTRVQFRVVGTGGRRLYVDEVQIAFTAASPTPTSTRTATQTPSFTPGGPTRTPTLTPTRNPSALPLDKTMSMVRCTTCHETHYSGSSAGMLLRNGNITALCTQCHTLADIGAGAHFAPSTGALWPGGQYGSNFPQITDATQRGYCSNCHRAHGWPDNAAPTPLPTPGNTATDYPLLLVDREENLCYTCHDGSPVAENVQAEFAKPYNHPAGTYTGRHSTTEDGTPSSYGTANRHAECADCHNPHKLRSDASAPVAPAFSNKLLGNNRISATNGAAGTVPIYTFRSAFDTTPAKEYEICFKCHSSWTTQPSGQANTALDFNTNNPSYHPVEALGKNTNIDANAFVNGWVANQQMYCSDCHGSDNAAVRGPHGSVYRYILKAPYTVGSGNRPMSANEICFACHRYDTYANDGASDTVKGYSRFNPPSFDRGHGFHVGRQEYPCYACHDSHASTTKPHLIATGRDPGLNTYTESAGGGTCGPTCHNSETYTINYAR